MSSTPSPPPKCPSSTRTLTVEEAKALAPNLARNPHAQAAMVRVWAKPERRYSAVADDMMKSEAWRFDDIKKMTHGLWHSGMFERDVENDVPNKKYANFDSRYQKLEQQVSKEAKSNDRLAAFETLRGDLSSSAPRIPGALKLWNELFAQAPDPDREKMLIRLVGDEDDTGSSLFQRAIEPFRLWRERVCKVAFRPGV